MAPVDKKHTFNECRIINDFETTTSTIEKKQEDITEISDEKYKDAINTKILSNTNIKYMMKRTEELHDKYPFLGKSIEAKREKKIHITRFVIGHVEEVLFKSNNVTSKNPLLFNDFQQLYLAKSDTARHSSGSCDRDADHYQNISINKNQDLLEESVLL